MEESPSLGAYPNPPSRYRLNSTIIEESPTQIEEDECHRWFPLVLEQGSDNKEEEIGVLEHRPLHYSRISVASLLALPEPMSGTRNCPMLVEQSPAPHYIVVEDYPAPQYIVVEESQVPMSGVQNRRCLFAESPPERTQDRVSTTFTVLMGGIKDQPSLLDDSTAVLKNNNLCRGGERNRWREVPQPSH